ncbi:MAG: acetamidase, partial [bacterium]
MSRRFALATVAVTGASMLCGSALAQPSDHYVPSRPETLSWGWFPLDKPPVLTIASGDTVRVDTLSHAGSTQREHPATLLRDLGVAPEDILPDV